jgi:peptidyl-prolyl cis-trans isomerase D
LQENETIASLRGPDGKLDMDRYRQLVGAQGMTPEMFENDVRTDLSRRQVVAGIAGSGFASDGAVADVSLNAFFEKREVQIARFPRLTTRRKINPTDAEIETFYKDNPALFQAPEQGQHRIPGAGPGHGAQGITVSEADLKTYYEQNAARLAGQEERRASHILITAPKSAPAADRQKARPKPGVAGCRAKRPTSFAEVARKNSQDPGSAASGGDLDFFARGAMVKPFEDAAFLHEKGRYQRCGGV